MNQRSKPFAVQRTRVAQPDHRRRHKEAFGGNSDFITWGGQKLHVRSYLKRFLFSDDRLSQRVEVLSGGERSRLLLAKIMCRGGNFLVLDEPTNDLDLATLQVLEEALLEFKGCGVVVSHDRWFLDRICDRVIVFEPGGPYVQEGNYSYYLEKNRDRLASEKSAAAAVVKASASRPREKSRKLTWKEERELEGLEARIMELEEGVAAIEAQLAEPAFFVTRGSEAPGMIEQVDGQKLAIQGLYARWEELEAVRAAAAG